MAEVTERLAVYGTLAPSQPNHHQLAGLQGVWRPGSVRGRLVQEGWGADLGFPGLVLDASGDTVAVQLFESPDLPDHWSRLDAFEGEGYQRVLTQVVVANEVLVAYIYVIRPHY